MEVRGEIQPAVVTTSAEQRREQRLVGSEDHARINPWQQPFRTAVPELLNHARFLAFAFIGDPASRAPSFKHLFGCAGRLPEPGKSRRGVFKQPDQAFLRFDVFDAETAAAVPGAQYLAWHVS